MMLYYGPGAKLWDYLQRWSWPHCCCSRRKLRLPPPSPPPPPTKPRKRKNVFALLFLLLYSHKLVPFAATGLFAYDNGGGVGRPDWHAGLALPLCAALLLSTTSLLRPALAANVTLTTNNNASDKSKVINQFSTKPPELTTAIPEAANGATIRNGTLLHRLVLEGGGGGVAGGPTSGAVTASSSSSNNNKSLTTNPPTGKLLHRLRYSQHSAGVYSSHLGHLDDEDDYIDEEDEEGTQSAFPMGHTKKNGTEKGEYVGASCEFTCSKRLHHVYCDPGTNECTCEKLYPVVIGRAKGCAKPKKIGEQCFYDQTCSYNDANSLCVQIRHNAKCECIVGFHSVIHYKPSKREFCTPDMAVLTSDLPTLLGVTSGIAVLAGLICMVLHLFSKNKYPRHRGHFADTHLPPPILYSSDTGIPLTLQAQSGRPSSRSSLRSGGSAGSYANRRQSSNNFNGSRRPSLASVHSTTSSVRSYSLMRFEKELQQKEMRQEMKLRLSQMQKNNKQQHQQHQQKPQINVVELSGAAAGSQSTRSMAPTPSPLTPNSTEELLPMVDETQEEFTSLFSTRPSASYNGPCSPFDGL